jgi:arsenate reductase
MSSINLLFVCIENSCRSQMAEGWANYITRALVKPSNKNSKILVFSAGSNPSGKVNPLAIAVMKEAGVDISRQRSKGLDQVPDFQYEYVVTMGCGDSCPFILANHREDWKLDDPGRYSALPKEQALAGFRVIRDQIKERVEKLISTLL